jgi:class 3 adenylate cyclase
MLRLASPILIGTGTSLKRSAVTRKLAAILIADVVGFSRLMERDEAGAFARLRGVRERVIRRLPNMVAGWSRPLAMECCSNSAARTRCVARLTCNER